MLRTIAKWAGGRRAKWYVVGFWLLLLVLSQLPGKLTDVTEDRISSFLPDDAAAIVADKVIETRFPGGQTTSSVAVYHRAGGLTDADKQAIADQAAKIGEVKGVLPPVAAFSSGAPEGLVSQDGGTAFTVIPINATTQQAINDVTDEVRNIANGGDGLTAQVTGPAALETDLRHGFESADVALLLVTGLLVLAILLIIYRSPVLALVPLITVIIAYSVASGLIKVLADGGMQVTSISTSLLLVLMFGAGTDYCLLLVARYVEELHTHEDKHDAIKTAIPRVGPAIIASAFTVTLAMLVLLVAELASTRTVGPVNAIGILIVMAASLTLLPAILAIVGRRGFWPSKRAVYDPTNVPDEALEDGDTRWARHGRRVTRRPWLTIGAIVIVFLIGAIGVTQYSSEASVLGAFRNSTEGTDGYDTLKAAFPEGALGPANVIIDRQDGPITDADIEAARSAMQSVPEVAPVTAVTGKSEDGKAAVFQVAFKDDPYGNPALDRTQTMRDELATLDPQIKGYVGGVSAIQRDYRDGAQHDLDLVVPLVLIVILLTLIALLRAIVAPLYLIGSVILSFFGILGVCLVFFTQVIGEPASTRASRSSPSSSSWPWGWTTTSSSWIACARRRTRSARSGVGCARWSPTGPVITSAGIILAGTFAVLAMLPITVLVELGTRSSLGVLIDTFLVRSMLVPAIITVVGDASWWPSKLSREAGEAAAEPEVPAEARPGAPV